MKTRETIMKIIAMLAINALLVSMAAGPALIAYDEFERERMDSNSAAQIAAYPENADSARLLKLYH
mgnify:CR=1 FL=1|tara:strand:- start:123 stop:320 length:198 start_codon:yes stop_codon:yes gene_type:complete